MTMAATPLTGLIRTSPFRIAVHRLQFLERPLFEEFKVLPHRGRLSLENAEAAHVHGSQRVIADSAHHDAVEPLTSESHERIAPRVNVFMIAVGDFIALHARRLDNQKPGGRSEMTVNSAVEPFSFYDGKTYLHIVVCSIRQSAGIRIHVVYKQRLAGWQIDGFLSLLGEELVNRLSDSRAGWKTVIIKKHYPPRGKPGIEEVARV